MSERHPYLRPQRRHWWAHPPYLAYTVRELCGVAAAIYAAILLVGLICLQQGPHAFAAFRGFLASPASLVLHLLLLAAMLWHTRTWFQILPKTLPKLVWRGKLIPQSLLTSVALLVAGACSVLLLVAAVLLGAFA